MFSAQCIENRPVEELKSTVFEYCVQTMFTLLGKTSERKKTFQFGHCPNYPKPPPPNSGNFTGLFRPTKTTFCAYGGKNTDDDNDCCHDNFDQNFGKFDDNDDKKY